MKVEEVNSYEFEFEDNEIEIINNAKDLLRKILDVLYEHKCECVECDDYEVSNIVSKDAIYAAYNMFDELRQASSIY